MPRLPRIIVPNIPHHVTQRGNRRQTTFFGREDYLFYLRNLREIAATTETTVVAYCLMPNHVHLVLIPKTRGALINMVSELHQRYSRYINFKNQWKGHLWQGRFFSVPLSPDHFDQCIRYVELNPIRANLIAPPEKYEWVSRVFEPDEIYVEEDFSILREMSRTGRPKGDTQFLQKVRKESGVNPEPKKPGRKSHSLLKGFK